MKSTAPERVPGILHLSHIFDAFLLDAHGVFWGGNDYGLLPGSKEAMETLVSSGKIVGILSNSTQLASEETDKFRRAGLLRGRHFHFLITSGETARSILLQEQLPFETKNRRFKVFPGPHPKFSSHEALFQGTVYGETPDLQEADFVYLSVPHIDGEDQTDPEVFREEVEKIRSKNIPMICANPDRFAQEGTPPRPVVRQGGIAEMYEKIGGRVFYVGKPHDRVYSVALDQFRLSGITDPKKILMVGDTPETDIRGARRLGIPSALTVQTGMTADRISRYGREKTLRDLPEKDTPNYFIERLADDLHSPPPS